MYGIQNLQALALALVATVNSLLKVDGDKDGKITLLELSGFALPFLMKLTGYVNGIEWAALKPEARDLKLAEILDLVKVVTDGLDFLRADQKAALSSALELVVYNAVRVPATLEAVRGAFGGAPLKVAA